MLEAVLAALDDAGYRDREFPRERTAVVLGAGGGAAQLAMGYAFRSYLPMLDTGAGAGARRRSGGPLLPEWTEDSFPGILLNVAAGRVANRFNLGGANYTVDAACGSSLAAAAPGRPRAGDGRRRRGHPGRGRHRPEPVHLHGLQQDPGLLAAGPLPPVRRRRRRHRDQRRGGRRWS